jgi:hypothetical protein
MVACACTAGHKGEDMDTQPQEPTQDELQLGQKSDWFLASLVNIANSGPIEFGITLQIGGLLVSGNLVNGARYFEGFASEFAGGFPDAEIAENIRKAIESHGVVYKPNDEDSKRSQPTFIHLREARFFNTAGKPVPVNKGVWWRGRLSEVSGFVLGSLRQD